MISRMIAVRKMVGLNQEQFAKRLGLSRSFVNQVETGKKNISDRTISDICREFRINETWFRTGEGEISISSPPAAIESLAIEYHLSQKDCVLIKNILEMSPEKRQAVMGFMLELAKDILDGDVSIDDPAIFSGNTVETSAKAPQEMSETELHAELDRQLAEEKKRAESPSAYGRGKSGTVAG